jgi:hypothetical protein
LLQRRCKSKPQKRIRDNKPIGVIVHIYMEIAQVISLYSYPYLKLVETSGFSFFFFFFLLHNLRTEGRIGPAKGVGELGPVTGRKLQEKGIGG